MFITAFKSALGTGLGLGAAAMATIVGLDMYEKTKEKVGGLAKGRTEFETWQKSPAVQKFLKEKHEREAALLAQQAA